MKELQTLYQLEYPWVDVDNVIFTCRRCCPEYNKTMAKNQKVP
jgi:hypothetical protein